MERISSYIILYNIKHSTGFFLCHLKMKVFTTLFVSAFVLEVTIPKYQLDIDVDVEVEDKIAKPRKIDRGRYFDFSIFSKYL